MKWNDNHKKVISGFINFKDRPGIHLKSINVNHL